MTDDRFEEDDVRQRTPVKKIVLSDGREYTHKCIFEKILNNGLKDPHMKEAFYRLIMETPISIEFSERENKDGIEIEKFLAKKTDRQGYERIDITIDGVDGDNPKFFDMLKQNGMTISF